MSISTHPERHPSLRSHGEIRADLDWFSRQGRQQEHDRMSLVHMLAVGFYSRTRKNSRSSNHGWIDCNCEITSYKA